MFNHGENIICNAPGRTFGRPDTTYEAKQNLFSKIGEAPAATFYEAHHVRIPNRLDFVYVRKFLYTRIKQAI